MTNQFTDFSQMWQRLGSFELDDKNFEYAYDSGRDDQLEQVLEWLKNCRDYDLFYIKDRALTRRELKKAMRPQQQEDNS